MMPWQRPLESTRNRWRSSEHFRINCLAKRACPPASARRGFDHSWLSENIAEGTSADDIHDQFMKSPNHRSNILDSDMDTVGIGVAESGGKWFAVEDFCKAK